MEEKIFYNSTDNIKLCGILNHMADNKKIVILCHGFNSNKGRSTGVLAEQLNKNSINTFRFDFRAQGESSGIDKEMTITGQIEDLESTMTLLKSKGYEEFILYGGSFGGGIVSLLDYSKYTNIRALILWCSTLDYSKKGKESIFNDNDKKIAIKNGFVVTKNSKGEVFQIGKELYKETEKYIPYKNLEKTSIPILLVHGTKDEHVPYEISKDLSLKCKSAKLITIPNGSHSLKDSEKAIIETIIFVKGVF